MTALPPEVMLTSMAVNYMMSHRTTINDADVAYLHQAADRALLSCCHERRVMYFEVAADIEFQQDDDDLHNSPAVVENIGRDLAARLAEVDVSDLGCLSTRS